MMQPDRGPGVRTGLNPAAQRILDRQYPLVLQLQHGGRGELFTDRGEAESGLQRQRPVRVVVGHAIDLTEQNLIAARDQHRPAEPAAAARDAVQGLGQFRQVLHDLNHGALHRGRGIRRLVRDDGPA